MKEFSDWIPNGSRFEESDAVWRQELKEALVPLATYEEAMVRPHAVWALYRLFGDEAKEALQRARAFEEDSAALEEYSYWDNG